MTLAVHELGMSFGRMDQPSERVRFLDDVDITVALDTRGIAGKQSMTLELDITPVIFRASYTEIMLIVDVVNKAAALASAATSNQQDGEEGVEKSSVPPRNRATSDVQTVGGRKSTGNRPQVIVSKQTVSSTFLPNKTLVPYANVVSCPPPSPLATRSHWRVPTGSYWRYAGSATRPFEHQAIQPECE